MTSGFAQRRARAAASLRGCPVALLLMLPLMLWSLWSFAQTPSVVTVGIVDDNVPYSNIVDGTASGFSVDVLRDVSEKSGIEFEFQAGNWTDIYDAFLNGRIDVIDGISYRDDRAEKILFTDPYHQRQIFLMHNPANPLGNIGSLDALGGKRLGALRDIYYLDALAASDAHINLYDSVAGLIRALAFGWVDGIVGPKLTLEYYANESGLRFLEIAGPAPLGQFSDEDFRLGVLKGNEGLFNALSDALNTIPEERLTELRQRWQEYGGASLNASPKMAISEAERRYLSDTGPVRVGFMIDYAPFSFRDSGALQGLSVDILDRVSDLTNIQFVAVSGQWSELYPSFVEGDIDIMANMSRTDERAQFVEFTRPYHVIPNVAFTRNSSLTFDTLEDLRGLKVALGAGIYYEQAVREVLGSDAKSYTSQKAMFLALASGEVDVVLSALPNGNHWVNTLNIPGVTIVGEVEFEGTRGEDLRFGVRSELARVAQLIDRALLAISPTEMNTIKNRWLGARLQQQKGPAGTVQFSEREQQWLEQRDDALILCLDPHWLPLEGINQNNQHVGISADVFDLFSRRGNIEFEPLVVDDWSQTIEAAKRRECDLFPMAMRTPQRTAYLNFTSPYLQLPTVLVGRIESPLVDSLDELGNQPIGIVRNYAQAELIKRRNPNLNLVEVDSEDDGLRQVQNRELAAYISTLATASHYMQELGLADLKVIGRVPADWSLSVATRNDVPELLGIMQKLVESLTEQEQRSIKQAWNRVELKQSVDYTRLIQFAVAALVILALLFYWNRKLGLLNRKLENANEQLARLSVTDDLTQLGNRSYFDKEFGVSFRWCERHKAGFAVAMVDADHFKKINDTYGHHAGDECLKALANTMSQHFRRETDRLSRFGGEEFVIFTTYNEEQELIQRFEDFRIAIDNLRTEVEGASIHFTISIGLATGIPNTKASQSEFLRQADGALYKAKKQGRNRLEVHSISE